VKRIAIPQILLSTTSFSKLWQLAKAIIPGPRLKLIPDNAASIIPTPDSSPD
jgi:hypothetical protein